MFVDVKLLPCPCCGKKDQITVEGGWKHGKCNRCGPRTAMLTVDGVTKPIMTWAEEVDIPYKTLWRRLSIGWEPKRAITTPVRRCK